MIDVALGMTHARTDTINGVGPIIQGDFWPILQRVFEPLAGISLFEFFNGVDHDRLRQTVSQIVALTNSISSTSPQLNSIFGNDALGLNRAAMLETRNPKIQAGLGLLWALISERSGEEFHDLDSTAKMFSAAEKAITNYLSAGANAVEMELPNFRRKPIRKPLI